ncbi:MAG: hypothetical protein E7Z99_01815 [Coriobacteriaceae bacterium]|nr:hypothetical protein [Coriobacteriaceae bacterium]
MLQGSGFILVYVLGAFVAVCISVFALAHTRHVNLSFLYEWAIPLIVFSLSFNALNYPHCGDAALILGCAAALYVEVLFYVIFSRIAANGLCLPSETFGIFRDVVQLGFLSKGRSVPYMREAMVLSKSTIETHVKHIYAKCDVHSKQELLDLIERYEQPETTPAPQP